MEQQKSGTIFINPKFKNAYINPNFLKNSATQIHFNPKFFVQTQQQSSISSNLQPIQEKNNHKATNNSIISNGNNSAIVKITKRSLIRAPATIVKNNHLNATGLPAKNQKLIRIGSKKLVKASNLIEYQQKENEVIKNVTKSLIKSKKLKNPESVYKVDRRKCSSSTQNKKISINNNSTPKKNYSRLLQKNSSIKSGDQKTLFTWRKKLGTDSSGRAIKKASSNSLCERDNSSTYQLRNRFALAKSKSISLLNRSSSKLSSVICPIYRRIGKCIAYANGKCSKLHDQRYIMVCPDFIRGTCQNDKCLLSHNANLHKMPVCKYYLQGLCLKSEKECLYLHKKVTDGTKICSEFIKGYCPLADKCNLLHDNIDGDRKKYSFIRSPAILKKRKKHEIAKSISTPITAKETRYFENISSPQAIQKNVPKVLKSAPVLPDFIKL